MSVSPEEKLKLMLKLGMEDAAGKYAEAHNLTTMRFRPISGDKIEELLSVEYQELGRPNDEALVGLTIVGIAIGAFFGLGVAAHTNHLYGWLCFAVCTIVSHIAGRDMQKPKMVTHTADVCQMPLEDWDSDLPYGALLSVKEAKAQGFYKFTIFFPAKDDSEYAEAKRIKDDPIIVALKKGHGKKMYNIFAWDDSKVYE